MRRLSIRDLRFAVLLALALAGCVAPPPLRETVQPPATALPATGSPTDSALATAQTSTSPLPSPTVELPVALPPPSAGADAWPRISLPGGGSFAYPPDSKVRLTMNMNYPDHGFALNVYSLAPEQESELYHEAGDAWTYRESPEFRVPWAQERNINGLDWHLYLSGYTEGGYTIGRPDFDRLWEKGALINATLTAVHYEPETQLAVSLGAPLTPDQLVLLDARGGDGIFPAQFGAFADILNSISFGINQDAAPPASDGSPVAAGAIPSAQPFMSPLPTPSAESAAWPALRLPGGGAFAYPSDAEVNLSVSVDSGAADPATPWVQDIQIDAHRSDTEPEPYEAGQTWLSPGKRLQFLVAWAETLNVNEVDWRLSIIGHRQVSGATGDESTPQAQGPLAYAGLGATHYDRSKGRMVSLSKPLTGDQLAILAAEGGDALFPKQFKEFTDILSTITLDH